MATITIKNIPDHIHQLLKKRAEAHHRSLNGEILAYLETAVESHAGPQEAFLKKVQALRKNITGKITDRMINRYKTEGRA